MKKGLLFGVIVIILAVIAVAVYHLTGGFTSEIKKFSLVYGDEYILQDTDSVDIRETKTFTVKHLGEDAEIKAEVMPLELETDFRFYINGYEYSWNQHVVKMKNPSKLLKVVVAQNKNTVTVQGRLLEVLQTYANEEVGEGTIEFKSQLPSVDMFCIAVSSGGSTISVNCRFITTATGIVLDKQEFKFGARVQ